MTQIGCQGRDCGDLIDSEDPACIVQVGSQKKALCERCRTRDRIARHGYSFDDDLKPIIEGKVQLPNPEPVSGDVGAEILHYREVHCGHALLSGEKQWNARFFLDYGQGGGLYGSGIVAWTAWKDGAYRAVGMKFAICKHKKVDAPNANHMRGWHPGHCTNCGLDMTVDSGD